MKTKMKRVVIMVAIFFFAFSLAAQTENAEKTSTQQDRVFKRDPNIQKKEEAKKKKEEDERKKTEFQQRADEFNKSTSDSLSKPGSTKENQPKEPELSAEGIPGETYGESAGLNDDDMRSKDFFYKPGGRRDPFVDLLRGKNVSNVKREAKEGIAGLLIDELELEGVILLKNGKYVALFKGPDKKSYDVYLGDSLYDGEVIKIELNTVYFKRSQSMALGGTKEKIITKSLIPEEEAENK